MYDFEGIILGLVIILCSSLFLVAASTLPLAGVGAFGNAILAVVTYGLWVVSTLSGIYMVTESL